MDSLSNGDWFETNDLSLFDGVHFDAPSVATIGERFVTTYLAIPEPSALALIAAGATILIQMSRTRCVFKKATVRSHASFAAVSS